MSKNKAIIAHGIVAGLVMNLSWWGYNWIFVGEGNYDDGVGEVVGYVTIALGMVEVFMGVRKYRDKLESSFPFNEAFLFGLGMVFVASLVYTIGWMLYSGMILPDFAEQYSLSQVNALEQTGASVDEVEALRASWDQWTAWYQNPFIKFGMTFMEIFPIGLLFSAIAAFILKKK
ncbi:MAG: DUF4199 domain-containing protein [Reichenbachiella sp.]